MTISAAVNQTVDRFEPGRIFGFSDLPIYRDAPAAVARAIGRLAEENRVVRVAKGRYCKPKQGLFGALKPADSELIRDVLYRNGRLRGYVTGPALYNRLGLTTQMPKTVTVAINGARQEKDFGTIRIKTVPSRAPVKKADVPLLEVLDALRDIKKIADSTPESVLNAIAERVKTFSNKELSRLQQIAIDSYNAATRALLGLLFDQDELTVDSRLRGSLNPLTRFDIGLDSSIWTEKSSWYIR